MNREIAYEASLLVAQAIGEVDEIVYANDLSYADAYEVTSTRHWNAKRKFTLKDARLKARHAAELLRQAWDLLDPPQQIPLKNKYPSNYQDYISEIESL